MEHDDQRTLTRDKSWQTWAGHGASDYEDPDQAKTSEADAPSTASNVVVFERSVPKPISLDKALDEMAYWWFTPPSASSNDATFLKIKSDLFGLRHSGMFSEGVSTYALQKQAYVTGDKTKYLRQQNRLLGMVKEATVSSDAASSTQALLALTVLAYCALQDGHFEFVQSHLHTVNSLGYKFFKSEDLGYEWAYIVWIDLGHSLVTHTGPVLPFFIPSRWRDETVNLSATEMSSVGDAATQASQWCPKLPKFTGQDSLELFTRLFTLQATTSQQWPLLGRFYEAIHRLASLQERVRSAKESTSLSRENLVGFLLVACQLQLRSMGRYWLPQGLGLRQRLLHRVCKDIGDLDVSKMLELWTSCADVSSLLWTLTTLCSCALECGLDASTAPLMAVRACLDALGVTTLGHFLGVLNEWPQDHTGKLRAVYSRAKSSLCGVSSQFGPFPTTSSQIPIEFAL